MIELRFVINQSYQYFSTTYIYIYVYKYVIHRIKNIMMVCVLTTQLYYTKYA